MPIGPGDEIAGYVIECEIGRGGMGAVYVAKHPRLPRRVALKLLSLEFTDDPSYRTRFEREADIAARFDHRNIVSVLDRGTYQGRLWIAMQYIEGMDAEQALRLSGGNGLGVARTAYIVSEVATALDVAHHHRLLHRDVKPANILLAPGAHPDEPERVLLSDFGISKVADDGPNLTGTGNLLATLAYAAPERILAKPSDHRADIYSLGCVLYELLVGAQPFPANNPYEAMHSHLDAAIPLPSATRPEIPAQIDDIVVMAMAKDPADRYSTAREMAVALRSANTVRATETSVDTYLFTGPTTVYRPVQTGSPIGTLTTLVAAERRNMDPQSTDSTQNIAPTTLSTDGNFRSPEPPVTGGRRRRRPALQWAGLALIVLMVTAGATMSIWRPWLTKAPTNSAGGPSTFSTVEAGFTVQSAVSSAATSTSTSRTSATTTPIDAGSRLAGNYTLDWVVVSATGDSSASPGQSSTGTNLVTTHCYATGCTSIACDLGGCFNFEELDLVWRASYDRKFECTSDYNGASTGVTVGYSLEMDLRIADQTSSRITLLTGTAVWTQTSPCDENDDLDTVTYELTMRAQE